MNTITLEQRDVRVHSLTAYASAVGFYFGFRLVAVVIAVRLFNTEPQLGVAVNLALNYLCLLAAAFLTFGPAARSSTWFRSIPSFRWTILFLLFSGCSLAWTRSASLVSAEAFWLAMASDLGVVVLLLRIGSIDDSAASLMRGFVWGTCAIAVMAWILPSQSDLRLGDEDYLGPNQVGFACAFAFFFAQYLMRRGRMRSGIPAIFLALTLLRSLSKTTIIAFVVAQAFLLVRDRSITIRKKLYLGCAAAAVTSIFWGILTAYYDVYTHAGNQSETLTGRVGIWAYILNEALQQPWIGHGFHSVWKVIPPFGYFEARHAHNEVLQQFYAYGVVGLVLLIGVYGSLIREIRKAKSTSIRILLQALVLFIVIRGFADTEVFDLSLPLWAIVLIGSLLANDATKEWIHA